MLTTIDLQRSCHLTNHINKPTFHIIDHVRLLNKRHPSIYTLEHEIQIPFFLPRRPK